LSILETFARVPSPAVRPGSFPLMPLVMVAWIAAAASLLFGGPGVGGSMSADDLMRLSQVRDFLAGQNWFDVSQYRLDPPTGSSMHWSRLVDLPLAFLFGLLTPFTGRAMAETVISTIWPMILFIPSLVLVGLLAKRLSNASAILPAILLAAVSAPSLIHFRPGALDHHGYQLLLMLSTLYGATDRGHARAMPALGGFAAALSIAIGLEMTPILAAVLAAVGLRWIVEGKNSAPLTFSFGIAFGAGTAALFVATVSPASWNVVQCDFISLPCVAAAGFSGGLLALLANASGRLATFYVRLAAGSIAGSVAITCVFIPFRSCLGDPYGMIDPRVATIWLSHVSETQNALEFAQNFPGDWLTFYACPLGALLLGIAAMLKQSRQKWAIFITPLFALFAFNVVALWEVRGTAGANLIAQPILAAALITLFQIRGSLLVSRFAIVSFVLLSNPILTLAGGGIKLIMNHLNPGQIPASDGGPLACRRPADMEHLARLSPGLVVSYIDIGPAILARTKHSVLAAPYHRNVRGNANAYDILLANDTTARRILKERQASYIAICPGSPDRIFMRDAAPDGLSERLALGETPNYLEPIPGSASEPLKIFRVR